MAMSDEFSFLVDSREDAIFRAEVRGWIEANVPRTLLNRAFRIEPAELRPWHRKLYERGWIAPHWPKSAGGMGATLDQQVILYEEMVRVGAPTPYPHGLNFIGPTIIELGTEAQKAKHLPGILTGEVTWCQGYSEPNAGSDLASLKTRAELVGDEFVINGQKIWTTNGHFADWMFALVRTDPTAPKKQQGLSMLLIDLKTPGITIRPIKTIVGDAEFAEEFFDNVRVPKENLLGKLNDGWTVANHVLGNERFATGTPRMAAELIEQTKRMAAASGAMDDAVFRDRLAALVIDHMAVSAYYRHGAQLHGAGKASPAASSVMKIQCGELAQRAAALLADAAGDYGAVYGEVPTPDGPVHPTAPTFEARRMSVGSGTTEIQRVILARRALGLPS
jgi:alkylation response protein AidB-like acyl-CoA dehydrogenase